MLAETVRLYVPTGVLPATLMLTVTACDAAPVKFKTADGEKLQEAPEGRLLHDRFTIPEKEPLTLT